VPIQAGGPERVLESRTKGKEKIDSMEQRP
jgi:hypothetical protein